MLNLLRRGTYSCGTMRSDRKGFPPSVKPIVKKGLPNTGDYKYISNGNLTIAVWQDTNTISCCFTNLKWMVTQVERKQKDGSSISMNCPKSIANYNARVGGVDRNDQLSGYYGIEIKSRKYYKYLFYAALDIAA